MRFRSLAPLIVLVGLPGLAGCESTPKQRLQGKWVGERVDNFPAGQSDRASGWVSGASFEFQGSRITVTIPAERPRKGTYKIARASDDELRVAFLRAHGASDEVSFRLEGEDRLRWLLGDGRSILLRKIND